MKKIISSVMSLIIILGVVFINSGQVKAYVANCPVLGVHDMKAASGRGTVIVNNQTVLDWCPVYQCTGCKDVMITETDAVMYGTIGYYAEYNPGYWVSPARVVLTVDHLDYAGLSIPGYRFRY